MVRRHPLALLSRLSGARGRPVSRDSLVALLWPEADPARARHSLSNVLSVVRRELGEDTLRTPGDDVRLDPSRVTSDAAEFEEALEQGMHGTAVGLYRGPFLDGFHLPDSESFEQWAREVRERYARAQGDALERLALEAEERGNWPEAARWWERRARHDPLSSRATVGLMSALVAAGDRAEALRRGEAHVERVESDFGVDPDPAVVALIDQIRGAIPPLHPAFHPEAFERARAYVPKVAVLPFENLCGEADAYLVEGLANDIITRLTEVEGLAVLSRTTALRYGDRPRSVKEIERETGVRYVVEGAVQRLGDHLRIHVQLIDATEDAHLWAGRYDRPTRGAMDVQAEIAEHVAHHLDDRLERTKRHRRRRTSAVDDGAYRLLQRARFHGRRRTRADVERTIELYERAVEADPGLARAHAGFVEAWFTARSLGLEIGADEKVRTRVRKAARRALEIDPELADAHVARALIAWSEADLGTAAVAFEQALELDAGLTAAHHRFAILLAAQGRLEESLREILTALALDPLSPVLHYNVGIKYLFARDYEGAIRRFRDALEIEPRWGSARSAIGLARTHQGRQGEAMASFDEAVEAEPREGEIRLEAAWALGRFGREAEARAAIEKGVELGGVPVETGIAFLGLGEIDTALDWIARGDWRVVDRPRRWDPRLDPVRTHPRFLELLGTPAAAG